MHKKLALQAMSTFQCLVGERGSDSQLSFSVVVHLFFCTVGAMVLNRKIYIPFGPSEPEDL